MNILNLIKHFFLILDINQQVLDDQTAQNLSNNNDSGIQRTRSSITRTLLMNNGETKMKIIKVFL